MGDTAAGLLTIGVLVLLLAATHAPLGAHLAHVFTTDRHSRVERRAYRIVGVNPDPRRIVASRQSMPLWNARVFSRTRRIVFK